MVGEGTIEGAGFVEDTIRRSCQLLNLRIKYLKEIKTLTKT